MMPVIDQPQKPKTVRRPVHGVLLLDKPLGLSSNDALQRCKWLLRAEKAGHTGTLDPLATGVLPLCFGAATKFSQLHLDADKTYEAIAQLGVTTSTGDAEGEVLQTRPVRWDEAQLTAAQQAFTGPIRQVPPMYSALKHQGRALYDYARAGVTVEREARTVVVHALALRRADTDAGAGAARTNTLHMRASVSKGTYIRTLAEDIGEALGCGAHLIALRRVQTGTFTAGDCISLEALQALDEAQRLARLLPVDSLLDGHRQVMLDADNAARFLSGLRRRGGWPDGEHISVYGPALSQSHAAQTQTILSPATQPMLLGTAHVKAGELIPGRLLSPIDIQQIQEIAS